MHDDQPIELRVQRRCRALIEPLPDNAMDEAIDADPRGDVVGASQDRSKVHPRSQVQSDLDALVRDPGGPGPALGRRALEGDDTRPDEQHQVCLHGLVCPPNEAREGRDGLGACSIPDT